jgi:hypothetical protein
MQQRISRRLSRWGLVLTLAVTAAPGAQGRAATAEPMPPDTPVGAVNAATRHHHPDVVQPPTRILTVTAADRFDWGDAGIGASGTLGALLIAAGSAFVFTRSRGRTPSPSGRLRP